MKLRTSATGPDFTRLAALVGDRARLAMLFALLDGRELPAYELAARANVSPQAASAHLRKLVESGFVSARREGRLRLFGLASADVARAFEGLALLATAPAVSSLRSHTMLTRLRTARSCYDHLAGKLGVAVMDAMTRERLIVQRDGVLALTRRGDGFVRELGLDPDRCSGRRALLRPCLDWSERRDHLAGSLAAAMLDRFLHARWLVRREGDRSLRVTASGAQSFASRFGIDAQAD